MSFLSPAWLLLLVAGGRAHRRSTSCCSCAARSYVARFSNVELLGSVAPRRPGWRRHLTFALLLSALTVLTVGVAQPAARGAGAARPGDGDAWPSTCRCRCEATDVLPTGSTAAKTAAKQFVDLLPARINLGLVSVRRQRERARAADRSTATRSRRAVDNLELRHSTAIGEAVFTSWTRSRCSPGHHRPRATSRRPRASCCSATARNNKRPQRRRRGRRRGEEGQGAGVDDRVRHRHRHRDRRRPDDPGAGRQADAALARRRRPAAPSTRRRRRRSCARSTPTSARRSATPPTHRDISWRFLAIGLLFALAAAGPSLLWSGRRPAPRSCDPGVGGDAGRAGRGRVSVGVEDQLADPSCGRAGRGGRRRPRPASRCRPRPGAARPRRSGRAGRARPAATGRAAGDDVHEPEADDRGAAGHQHAGRHRRRRLPRPAIPNTASRPSGASAARLWSNTGPPVISSTMSTGGRRWPRAAPRSGRPRVESTATSAPELEGELRAWRRVEAVAMTRPAPQRLASWIGDGADPARAGVHDDALAGGAGACSCAAGATPSRPAPAW